MKWIFTTIFLYLTHAQTAWCSDIDLKIGANDIRANIANTSQSRKQGLMSHTRLCSNCGMLFVFPETGKYNFWMKNTPLPLSIAFIAANGRILNIDEMQTNTMTMHSAQGEALYVLEMNKGWFTDHAIKPKDYVQGLELAPAGQ